MNLVEALSIGTVFQNVAFYTLLLLLLSLNLNILKLTRKLKELKSSFANHS